MSERTIKVDALARVEGEGALTLRTRGDQVEEVSLRIFEPPRFFEAFLRGRPASEAPDITSRICGICPVAYQMSAVAALEDAVGLTLPPELYAYRRLLYCGEWIESHVLHMVMLHAPDFLGFPDAMTMAREHGPRVRDGLRIKKAGNSIVRLLGGREIHPINVKVGGFYRLPRREQMLQLADELASCRAPMEELLRWMATFPMPQLHHDQPFVAMAPGGGVYPFIEGPLRSDDGLCIEAQQWPEHFEETQVQHSTALHARMRDGRHYLVGPQARFALNFTALPAHLQALARELDCAPPVRNPFRSLLVRGLEVLFALEEGERLCRSLRPDGPAALPVRWRAGTGHGLSEAPRGTLYHRYEIDEQGIILDATIVPPTSQNQATIEADLRAIAPQLIAMDLEPATHLAEQTIRNYDPCISCSVHFLRLIRISGGEQGASPAPFPPHRPAAAPPDPRVPHAAEALRDPLVHGPMEAPRRHGELIRISGGEQGASPAPFPPHRPAAAPPDPRVPHAAEALRDPLVHGPMEAPRRHGELVREESTG